MRGPNSHSKDEIDEEIVDVSTKCDTKYENELQTHNASCSRTVLNADSKKNNDDGTPPIWKIGRILIDSLSKGKMRRTKIFGAALEDLPLNCQGIPKIVQRLCCHLENYGMKEPELFVCDKKYGKLIEKLRISFDRAGDADLESCEDVKVVAALLKLWLHDLPYRLISQKIGCRLKIIFQKYDRKEVYDLNGEISNVLITCSTLNLGVLYTVVRLLHCYVTKWYPSLHVDQVPEIFAKFLFENVEAESVEIVTTLIHNFREIFNERVLERAFKFYIIRDKKSRDTKNTSKIDTPVAITCDNLPLAVDKLPRSNSEENLDLPNGHDQKSSPKNLLVTMRRVSSEEDFRGSQRNRCRGCRIVNVRTMKEERENDSKVANAPSYRVGNLFREQYYDEPVIDECQKMMCFSDDSQALVAPPPFRSFNEDYKLHEKIRNEERFTPQFHTYRNIGRKKHTIHHGHDIKPNIQTIFEDDLKYAVPKLEELFDNDVYERYLETSAYLEPNLPPENDPHLTSLTLSSSSSDYTSPMKIIRSPESIRQSFSRLEPLIHHRSWAYPHQHPYLKVPNSNYQSKEENSSHSMRLSHIDSKILQVNKHLQWLKKKMKHFERDFEVKYGDSPTIMNKMSHPEYKQMSMTIIYLKHNLKQLRKEANESFVTHRLLANKNQNNIGAVTPIITNKEKEFKKAEKQLRKKRLDSGRPECVENMTYEQLQDEKVSIQKELSNLENIFGQTTAQNEAIFDPIYSRYRILKRILGKTTASLKSKGTITDLATIMENETMEFENSPQTMVSNETKSSSVSLCQPVCNVSRNDFPVGNIYELSSPELMMAYKTTNEEKKRLRNRISMYEQEAENNTTNDSKHCIHSLRCRYKNTKAKLKLLEALLMKTK